MFIDHEIQTYGNVLKYAIFFLNFVIWVLGGLLLCAGIWIRVDGLLWEYTEALAISRYNWACYFAMIVGSILLITSFIGCLGAATESPFLLSLYGIATVVCILFEVVATILVWKIAGGDELQAVLSKGIYYHVENININADSRRFLDIIQLKLECCGAYNHLDYDRNRQPNPVTCNSIITNNIQIRSCGEMLRRYLEKRGAFIGGVSLGLVLLQIFILIFKSCLLWIMKETREEYPKHRK